MSNVLVTGGAGFIGTHLVRSLKKSGHEVRVIDSYERQVHAEYIKRMEGRLVPPDHFAMNCGSPSAFQHVQWADKVVHLAAAVGVGQSMYEPAMYVERNTLQTACLLDMMKDADRPDRLVVASSMSIYGEGRYMCDCANGAHYVHPTTTNTRRFEMPCPDCGKEMRPCPAVEDMPINPTSVYGITKRDQEELSLVWGAAYDFPVCALRFFNVYGEGQSLSNPYTGAAAIFANRIMDGERPIIFEDGMQSRDFIHVSDIVRGIEAALGNEYVGPVNLGTGVRTTLRDLAHTLQDILDPDPTGGEPIPTGEFREGDIRHGCADIRRARRVLGWAPTVTLRDGMERTTNWMRAQGSQGVRTEAVTLRKQGLLRK